MIAPSPLFDEKKRQSLEIMFGSLCIITKIILLHHLKGSKYNMQMKMSGKKLREVVTQIAERKFLLLDWLIMAKPNFNMINHVLRFIFFLLIFYQFLFQIPKRKKCYLNYKKKNRNKNLGSTTVLTTKNNNNKKIPNWLQDRQFSN